MLSGKLDLFICNLSHSDGCPKHCKCVEQTNQNRMLVNCESTGQKVMPDLSRLPDWYNIELNLAGNQIKTVKSMGYLNRTTVLNLSGNALIDIVPDVFKALENKAKVIDISNNEDLNFEDLEFRNIDRCVLNIDGVVMECDCNHKWIEGCLKQEKNQRIARTCENSTFYCETESGSVVAPEFSWNCEIEESATFLILSSIFGSMAVVTLFSVFFLEKFKLELYLFYRYQRIRSQSIYFKYDIYLLASDAGNTNREIKKLLWIRNTLLPLLERNGYKVHFPARDADPDSTQYEEIEREMLTSRNFLVVLSTEFKHEAADNKNTETNTFSRCHLEWKTAWKYFKSYQDRKITVINYDHIRSREAREVPHG